jgi:hypothetical protein
VIVEWLMDVAASLWDWLLTSTPQEAEPPPWLLNNMGAINEVVTMGASVSYWVPIDVGMVVAVAVIGCWLFAMATHVVRLVISLFAGAGSV